MVFGLICMEIDNTGARKPWWVDLTPPTEEHKMLFSLTRFLSSKRLERPNHGHFGLDFDHFGLIYSYIWMNCSENIRIKHYSDTKKIGAFYSFFSFIYQNSPKKVWEHTFLSKS